MKKVLITGATSGIGGATLKELVNKYEVIFTYHHNEEKALEITSKYHIKGYYLDLGDKESIEKLVDSIDNIDILINNAAICLDNSFEDKTYMEFSKVVNVNLTGTYYLTKLLSKKINNGGNILFISSTNGIDTYYIESIDYDASKAGVISLMHNFAKQLAPIRVNAIAPGWVDTEMNASMSDKFKKNEEEHILLKRFASPEEISKVINFVISDDASYINDTVIRVDGGVNNG